MVTRAYPLPYPFRYHEPVRTPEGAYGIVRGVTVHGSIIVQLPIVNMTFPFNPSDLERAAYDEELDAWRDKTCPA